MTSDFVDEKGNCVVQLLYHGGNSIRVALPKAQALRVVKAHSDFLNGKMPASGVLNLGVTVTDDVVGVKEDGTVVEQYEIALSARLDAVLCAMLLKQSQLKQEQEDIERHRRGLGY